MPEDVTFTARLRDVGLKVPEGSDAQPALTVVLGNRGLESIPIGQELLPLLGKRVNVRLVIEQGALPFEPGEGGAEDDAR